MPEIDWKEFSKHFGATRRRRKYTLRYLEQETGVNKSTLSRAEHGLPLSAAHFVILCSWVGMNPHWFLRSTD